MAEAGSAAEPNRARRDMAAARRATRRELASDLALFDAAVQPDRFSKVFAARPNFFGGGT